MSKEELTERIFCHEMKVDNQILRRGKSKTVEKEMMDFSKIIRDVPLYMVDGAGSRIEDIEKILNYSKENKMEFKAIFLDYLQLMKSDGQKKRNYEIGEYLRRFRSLAKQRKFCLIVLSQISRAAQDRVDRRPMLHELKDSGDIEQDSDTVLMLYWNANNEKREQDQNKYEVIIAKQRHGCIGKAQVKFRPEIYSFSEF